METILQVFYFLMLFALVVALAWLTSRLLGARLGVVGGGAGRQMRVLEVLPLGRDRSLLLVAVAGRYLLVGAGPQGFTLLQTLDDPDSVARLAALSAQAPSGGPLATGAEPFRRILDRLRRGDREDGPKGGGQPS